MALINSQGIAWNFDLADGGQTPAIIPPQNLQVPPSFDQVSIVRRPEICHHYEMSVLDRLAYENMDIPPEAFPDKRANASPELLEKISKVEHAEFLLNFAEAKLEVLQAQEKLRSGNDDDQRTKIENDIAAANKNDIPQLKSDLNALPLKQAKAKRAAAEMIEQVKHEISSHKQRVTKFTDAIKDANSRWEIGNDGFLHKKHPTKQVYDQKAVMDKLAMTYGNSSEAREIYHKIIQQKLHEPSREQIRKLQLISRLEQEKRKRAASNSGLRGPAFTGPTQRYASFGQLPPAGQQLPQLSNMKASASPSVVSSSSSQLNNMLPSAENSVVSGMANQPEMSVNSNSNTIPDFSNMENFGSFSASFSASQNPYSSHQNKQ